MDFEVIEGDIVMRLKAKLTDTVDNDVTVIPIPEDETEILPAFGKRNIIVAFASENGGEDNSLSMVSQDTDVIFSVLLQGKRLRGESGLYQLAAKVKLALIGFRPTDCQKLTYGSWKFIENQEKVFKYLLDFKTVGVAVEDIEDETGPAFKDVVFNPIV